MPADPPTAHALGSPSYRGAVPATPPRDRFRAEIAALRAVAVLMVVLFHLWPGRLPGGYVGVAGYVLGIAGAILALACLAVWWTRRTAAGAPARTAPEVVA